MTGTSTHHMGFANASEIAALVKLNEAEKQDRTSQMANAMLELRGSNGNATQEDLHKLGFSTAEILNFGQTARELAVDRGITRTTNFEGQILEQFSYWVKQATLNKRPFFGSDDRCKETRQRNWTAYCTSRTAFHVDPSIPQKKRCLLKLAKFLELHPIPSCEQNGIIKRVDLLLQNILKARKV